MAFENRILGLPHPFGLSGQIADLEPGLVGLVGEAFQVTPNCYFAAVLSLPRFMVLSYWIRPRALVNPVTEALRPSEFCLLLGLWFDDGFWFNVLLKLILLMDRGVDPFFYYFFTSFVSTVDLSKVSKNLRLLS